MIFLIPKKFKCIFEYPDNKFKIEYFSNMIFYYTNYKVYVLKKRMYLEDFFS